MVCRRSRRAAPRGLSPPRAASYRAMVVLRRGLGGRLSASPRRELDGQLEREARAGRVLAQHERAPELLGELATDGQAEAEPAFAAGAAAALEAVEDELALCR